MNVERMLMVTALCGALAWASYPYFTAWNPYDRVKVVQVQEVGGGVHFVADFRKLECDFNRFFVFGLVGDVPTNLRYQDVDEQFQDQDRPIGEHRLNILIDTDGISYDAFEFRTRHLCPNERDGEKVDRVFAVVEAP